MKKILVVLLIVSFSFVLVSAALTERQYGPDELANYTDNGFWDENKNWISEPVLGIYIEDKDYRLNDKVELYFNGMPVALSENMCDRESKFYNACNIIDGLFRNYFDLNNPRGSSGDGWFFYGIDTTWMLKYSDGQNWDNNWDNDLLWKVVKKKQK